MTKKDKIIVQGTEITVTVRNALFIRQELKQSERLVQLNNVAITQMRSLYVMAKFVKGKKRKNNTFAKTQKE